MKKEDQQDATIRYLLLISVSTCFGHHYAHLQENKGPITAFGVQFWFCWMWLVAVVGRCLAGCDHYEGFCSTTEQKPSKWSHPAIGGASTQITIFIGKGRSHNTDKSVGTSQLLHNDRLFFSS